jgi:dihydropteroate synthase
MTKQFAAEVEFPKKSIVGILNITPDSFSDGGEAETLSAVLQKTTEMIQQGASVIDVGAESTRPSAIAISPAEEWQRLYAALPEVIELCRAHNNLISVDTRHPETAQKAITLGVDWVNDVSGEISTGMLDVLKESPVKYVLTHSLGAPANPTNVMDTTDVVGDILVWAAEKISFLESEGIIRDRVIFDPGIGFGKNAEDCLKLIQNAKLFHQLGVEILYGHSRKSFLSRITYHGLSGDRDKDTAQLSRILALQGVQYLRVHNVAANLQAIRSEM